MNKKVQNKQAIMKGEKKEQRKNSISTKRKM